MKISACWIAKNEADNIAQSIESLGGIAEELIVVDTGSSDDTAAIAESYGARVEHFEWINDFSAARNYALSLATNDIIIFLDADECYDPPLDAASRELIEKTFTSNSQVETILTQIKNIDKHTGEMSGTNLVCRIFLNRENIRYQGKVHEFLDPTSRHMDAIISDSMSIRHSGYSKSVAASKLRRNIALLEASLDDSEGDDRIRFMIYLIREYHNRRGFDYCIGHITEILQHPRALERLCKFHADAFIPIMYPVMWSAFHLRAHVSRRDVHQKLFNMFKKVYVKYPGSEEIDLLYQALFDMKEDRFLRELEHASKAVAGMKPDPVITYQENERFLFEKAAYAAWRRGDRLRAMDYAVSVLKNDGGKHKELMLCILLNAVKGQPPEDVLFLLNGIFNISAINDLNFLINGTCVDGFNVVHSYYLKKRMESENANADDYLRFMLVYGQFDAAAEGAAEAYSAGNTLAAWYLFLAAVCGASPSLIKSHSHMLGEYTRVLDAYYNRERLAAIPESDAYLLRETYAIVAFAAGMEAADFYLDVFRANPVLCLSVKATYCEKSALHEELAREDMTGVPRTEFDYCWRRVIQAMILTGRCDDAVREIEAFLKAESLEPDLIHMLLAASEIGTGDVKTRARKLYKQYADLYDALVDLDDIVTTGIVVNEGEKKQTQYFRSMNRAQFDKYLKEEAARPVFGVLLTLCRQAADICKKNGQPAEAARYLCRVAAHGRADSADYENLAEFFAGIKNSALAGYVRGLAVS